VAAHMTQAGRCKAAIADQHDLALGKPASHEPDQELCSLYRRAMPFAQFGTGRWSQRGNAEHRQSPAALTPRHSHQEHQAHPVDPIARSRRVRSVNGPHHGSDPCRRCAVPIGVDAVPSMSKLKGASGARNAITRSPSSMRLRCKGDHTTRLRAR